jgi:hypothetical protein
MSANADHPCAFLYALTLAFGTKIDSNVCSPPAQNPVPRVGGTAALITIELTVVQRVL